MIDVQFAVTGNVKLDAKGYISSREPEVDLNTDHLRGPLGLAAPQQDMQMAVIYNGIMGASDPSHYIDLDHGDLEPEPPRNNRSRLPPEDPHSSVRPGEGNDLQPCGPAESAPEGRSTDAFGLSQLLIDEESTLVSPVGVPYTDPGYVSVPKNVLDRHEILGPVESDDTLTEYPDVSSIADTKRNAYVYELADDLYAKVDIKGHTQSRVIQICEALPWLLKTFASRIGHNASTQMHRDVMYFVHRHHREISDRFRSLCMDEDLSTQAKDQVSRMPPKGLIENWRMGFQEPMDDSAADWGVFEDDPGVQLDDDLEERPEQIPDNLYTDFVVCTPAYDWLLDSLRKRLYLTPTDSTRNRSIRETILSSLVSTRKVSRKTAAETYQMTFSLAWDPLHFTQEQGYTEAVEEVIEYAITLTGNMSQAQAMPCGQYLSQVWPSSGSVVLQMLQNALREPEVIVQANLRDDTKLQGSIDGPHFNVQVSGIRDSIAEVGEQLAWLGSALRSSTDDNLALCRPCIENIAKSSPDGQTIETSPNVYTCHIQFRTYQHGAHPTITNGRCWHDMFRNPTIVEGFPILERPENMPGLEIPLNIMAALIQTRRIDTFNDTPYIKGFSSMLYPTKSVDNFLLWHHLFNKDGNRIPFTDERITGGCYISRFDLPTARHIVGWCSEVEYCAGSANAMLSIEKARLPRPHSGCILDKVTLNAGYFITGGMEVRLGHKDVPLHISRDGYRKKLQWMEQRFVVLWDSGQNKGWLVNGNSALLHLTRASLEHNRTDGFSSEFCFDSKDIKEPSTPNVPGSALEVLRQAENRRLPLYEENGSFTRFENRVEDLCDILGHIIDYQHRAAGQNGVRLKLSPRRHLEGWDFKDLATERDPIYPRVAVIPTVGRGWVDFVRDIQAIVLFGRGFGEIIRPAAKGEVSCTHWTSLPPDTYYLAAAVADLRTIMELEGDPNANPPQLSENILWHQVKRSSKAFQCKAGACITHPDFVQVLLPVKEKVGNSPSKRPSKPTVDPNDVGAVVFGHNKICRWFYPDVGPPQQGDPPSPGQEPTSPFDDSGLGTSLVTLSLSTSAGSPDANQQSRIGCSSSDSGLPFRSGQGAESPDGTGGDHTPSMSAAQTEDGQSAGAICHSEVQTADGTLTSWLKSWTKNTISRAGKGQNLGR
ncbi:hypothetical protein LTR72_004263 [Exophiala xenobiotica]|nr:hypothetical protein LTR72_004263 [Exophiala xenobiotica]KAK5473856.1 hypothetical protein LTR55_010148 [Exophiala xenobiotica]